MDLRKFFSLYFSRSLKTNPDNRSFTFACIVALCILFFEYAFNAAYFSGLSGKGMTGIAVQFMPFFSMNFYLIFILLSWFLYINRYDHLLPYSAVFRTASVDIRKLYTARSLGIVFTPLSVIYLLFIIPFAVFILQLPYSIFRLLSVVFTILIIDILLKSFSALINRKKILVSIFSVVFYFVFLSLVYLNPQYNFIEGHPEVITTAGSFSIDLSYFSGNIIFSVFYNPFAGNSVPVLLADMTARLILLFFLLFIDIRIFGRYIQKEESKSSSALRKPGILFFSAAAAVIYIIISLAYRAESQGGRYLAVFTVSIIAAPAVFSVFRHEKTALIRLLNSCTDLRKIIIRKHLKYFLYISPVLFVFVFSCFNDPASCLSFIHFAVLPISLSLPVSLIIIHISPCSKNLNPVSILPFAVPLLYAGSEFNRNYPVSILLSVISLLLYFRILFSLESDSRRELLKRI